ncbi:MAG: class I SAM-dependent methyltransferase [Clostridia bacterium]|nr:class I SAM-dependent methyltransferase [Clostridia bacterium]MBQ4290427.1 class I SAM-dependent methyltransferase [Clostridia bacterium]
MLTADRWTDYSLLDTSDGMRLERWADYILERPDPQVIWKNRRTHPDWNHANARYNRSPSGGGNWEIRSLPESWTVSYESLDLRFYIHPMGFKHTGLFPEQAVNWEWFSEKIRNARKAGKEPRVLNLFAYTGGATVAAARAGASVVHVDAAKGMVATAKMNAHLCGLDDAPIRYIVEDCRKFVEREIRRGNRYDAVILDPPSYGRGARGEVWKLEDSIGDFLDLVTRVLSDEPLFVLLNSYTAGLSPSTMAYLLHLSLDCLGGSVSADEIGLPVVQTGNVLPCGSSARWETDLRTERR